MELGDRIKLLREEENISRENLADYLNISYAALSKYETNSRFPDKNTLNKFADYFNVSIDYLMGRTDIKKFEDLPKEVQEITNLFAGVDELKAKRLKELLKELLEK